MPRMLVAASPVEIEAKAEEAGLPEPAHRMARRMFHELTDCIAQATIARERQHEDWPNHRFYFGTVGQEMAALVEGLEGRADIVDITAGGVRASETPDGLYARDEEDNFIGVLVAHRNHEGMRSPS
jgi:hypothetical protein